MEFVVVLVAFLAVLLFVLLLLVLPLVFFFFSAVLVVVAVDVLVVSFLTSQVINEIDIDMDSEISREEFRIALSS